MSPFQTNNKLSLLIFLFSYFPYNISDFHINEIHPPVHSLPMLLRINIMLLHGSTLTSKLKYFARTTRRITVTQSPLLKPYSTAEVAPWRRLHVPGKDSAQEMDKNKQPTLFCF